MRFWQDFLDSLNTDGGHILLLLALFVFSIFVGIYWHLENASNVALQVFSALLMMLKTVGSNKTRRERPTPVVETSTATVTETATNEQHIEEQRRNDA